MLIRFKLTTDGTISINPAAVSSVTQYGIHVNGRTDIHMINRDTHYVVGSVEEVTNTLNGYEIADKIGTKKTRTPTPIRTAAKRK